MILLTEDPISVDRLVEEVRNSQSGAIVTFLGTTREFAEGKQTVSLVYEAYKTMAEKEMRDLQEEACRRWELTACAIAHRLGQVPLAETSVGIAVAAPHRAAAFGACEWLISSLKERVPIWKQEHWADGTTEWVHSGIQQVNTH